MVLALIGNLFVNWSNNESLLVYLIDLFMEDDRASPEPHVAGDEPSPSAVIVFSTLNTTRARIDLIRRLSRFSITDSGLQDELDRLLARFEATTRIRNEFNHAMYLVDQETGELTHTQSTRIVQRGGKLKFGATKKIDQARIETLKQTIQEMCDLNGDIRDLLTRLGPHLETRRRR
ncbi:MAG: hypothetical protein MPJ78_11955 [Hyphomicrobiaceae bacterium]|nr:hypothetical protein [Hyphomicrobiaceae bacterium]